MQTEMDIKFNTGSYHYVDCSYEIGDWIEAQDISMWKLIGPRFQSKYWVSDELYTVLLLKWTNHTNYKSKI